MDPQNQATTPTQAIPMGGQTTPPTPKPKKSGGFLSILVKLFLLIIFGSALLLGGFYLGSKSISQTPETTPSPTVASSPTATIPSPTLTSQKTKAVKAGLTGGNFFTPYIIDIPDGWTDARETTVAAGIDKLTLTKNGYSVTIYQAAMGGGGCLYPSDKPAEMSQTFTDFTDINGKSGQFRRSWNEQGGAKTLSYTVCKKGSDNSYGVLTPFGAISVASPNPAEPSILAEIDGMIASLNKQ